MCMCGVGAKPVAHLMKFHLLQWEVVKAKFLMNSNMTLTVLNLHQKTSYTSRFPRYSLDKIL